MKTVPPIAVSSVRVAVIRIEGSVATVEHEERRHLVHVSRVKAMYDEAKDSPEPTPEQDPFS